MDSYQGCKSLLITPGPVVSKCVQLISGHCMPIIGYGTFKVRGKDNIHTVVDAALSNGYKLFDTASVYGNYHELGEALKKLLLKFNLKREDIFITGKLAPNEHGDRVEKAVQECLKQLKTNYIDLYLIHWPGVSGIDVLSQKNAEVRFRSWREMERLHDNGNGILKSIGVSNYTTRHLRELLQLCVVKPAVNQVEFHPHYQHSDEFYNICQQNNIILQAYSSLGGDRNSRLLKEAAVLTAAEKYHKTPGQVLLRWGLQAGYAIIPKSQHPERIAENSELDFTLSDSDFESIKNLSNEIKYAWDPNTVL